MVQESAVDLKAVTEVILADLGATLQILRLAGREFGASGGCPRRIQDCIASLGFELCVEAVAMGTWPVDKRHPRAHACWTHSRQIAEYCHLLAGQLEEMNTEDAYLVGLFHELGALPGILGWQHAQNDSLDEATAGYILAKQWLLPDVIADSMLEVSSFRPARWTGIVLAAHELAKTGVAANAIPVTRS
ncbi:HDOD domain-containing protein [Acidobacteria bacterium AB60]|nr:HDOD domain-containing protein [Acidobacteria bacterium AB60]